MFKINTFLGKLDYLKIIKYTAISLWLSAVSFLLLLQYALDGLWENPPYLSESICFEKANLDLFLTSRSLGLLGNYPRIYISKVPYQGSFEKNNFGKNIIFTLQQDELFYKTNGNDTVLVYSNFSGKHDSVLFDSLGCKVILKRIDSTSDFKRYHIHKFNCNKYGYKRLGY
ncbi:MAG: hypothetical protein ACOVMN_06530 [Flexibacteraceae bacterium]